MILTLSSPKPRWSLIARFRSCSISLVSRFLSTKTLERDKSAPFTSNDGFSVVAPIKVMLPFSTKGRNASCCALLNLWISSINTIVFSPNLVYLSACCITVRISLMPLVTAEKVMKFAFVLLAIICASVVFPTPGGPQKIIDGTLSDSISLLRILPSPTRCC